MWVAPVPTQASKQLCKCQPQVMTRIYEEWHFTHFSKDAELVEAKDSGRQAGALGLL